MAGLLSSKRQRDEAQIEETKEGGGGGEELKRQKSYNQIMSLLEEEEEEAIQDLSSIITTLQQEITFSSSSSSSIQMNESHIPNNYQNNNNNNISTSTQQDYSNFPSKLELIMEEEGEERERVMRHLLEASDDELGIVPNDGETSFSVGEQEEEVGLSDAFWELEDEAANYYTLFHSHLFMYL